MNKFVDVYGHPIQTKEVAGQTWYKLSDLQLACGHKIGSFGHRLLDNCDYMKFGRKDEYTGQCYWVTAEGAVKLCNHKKAYGQFVDSVRTYGFPGALKDVVQEDEKQSSNACVAIDLDLLNIPKNVVKDDAYYTFISELRFAERAIVNGNISPAIDFNNKYRGYKHRVKEQDIIPVTQEEPKAVHKLAAKPNTFAETITTLEKIKKDLEEKKTAFVSEINKLELQTSNLEEIIQAEICKKERESIQAATEKAKDVSVHQTANIDRKPTAEEYRKWINSIVVDAVTDKLTDLDRRDPRERRIKYSNEFHILYGKVKDKFGVDLLQMRKMGIILYDREDSVFDIAERHNFLEMVYDVALATYGTKKVKIDVAGWKKKYGGVE